MVAGGAGFIGSHLCHRLLNQGCYVVCVDNLYTGSRGNIQDLMSHPNFEFIEADVTEPVHMKADKIYNLACPASPVHYQRDPIKTLQTNFLGAMNLLELAREENARILLASTSEIYGDPLVHPQVETYKGNVNTVGSRACYDEGKRVAEALFYNYQQTQHVDTRIVRIFNTYGPRMDVNDGRVISNFVTAALKNEDILVFGNGSQTRSFCYVDDLVDGLIAMMDNDSFAGPVNLGNPCEMTILDLAELIKHKTGSSSKIVFRDIPQDDPVKRRPDIGLARKELNWSPQISLDQGLDKTICYFSKLSRDNT